MLTFTQTKTLLNDPSLCDDEVEQIRVAFQLLAELVFDTWIEEGRNGTAGTSAVSVSETLPELS
jgi:hypothetical protein